MNHNSIFCDLPYKIMLKKVQVGFSLNMLFQNFSFNIFFKFFFRNNNQILFTISYITNQILEIKISLFKIINSEVLTLKKSQIWKPVFEDVILKLKYIGYNLFKIDQIFLNCALHEPSFNLVFIRLLLHKYYVNYRLPRLRKIG